MLAELLILVAPLLLVPLAVLGGWMALRRHRRRAARHARRRHHRIEL
ncbi:MAG: hypothetical protein ACK40O_11965 [Allosphingosinicella sp.]